MIQSLCFSILSQGQILLINFIPESFNVFQPILVHRFLVPASAVSDHPFPMVVNGKSCLNHHLNGTVHGNDDQHPFSVPEWSCSCFGDDNINVDENIGQETVDEQPK